MKRYRKQGERTTRATFTPYPAVASIRGDDEPKIMKEPELEESLALADSRHLEASPGPHRPHAVVIGR
jgi:hypothetical protein